jgi:L-cystine uptake protein TcyP (sodium:dicarboxylate symporter family)
MLRNFRKIVVAPAALAAALVTTFGLNGCAVIAIADAAVVVASTAVKATADVAGAAVHATAAGVKAMTKDDEAKKEVSK